jgi:adenylosuccinate synthase
MKTRWAAAAFELLICSICKLLKKHIENAVREKNMIAHALFNSEPLDADKMYTEYAAAAEKIAPFVCDTAVLLNQALGQR